MATKKKVEEVNEEIKEEITEEEAVEEIKETKRKGKHKVYFEPSEFEGDDYVLFGINGNVTAIRRGVEVEVSDELYESIMNSRSDDKVARDRMREHKKNLEKMAKL